MSNKKNEPQENDEVELLHRTLIEEEGIDESKLPEEIQELISKFNDLESAYEENPSQETFYELQQLDVAIADEIHTHIEDENIEEEEEEEYEIDDEETNQKPKNNHTQTKPQSQMNTKETKKPEQNTGDITEAARISKEKTDAEKTEADRLKAEHNKPNPDEALLAKLKSKLRNNRISNEDLSELLGVDEADNSEYKIAGLKLKKVYLGDGEYELKS